MVFDGFDTDQSGTINKEELIKAFTNLGIEGTTQEFEASFEILDSSGDGELDFKEFIELYHILNKASH